MGDRRPKSAIVTIDPGEGIDKADRLQALQFLVEQADENLHNALAKNTRTAYRNQWNRFIAWCGAMDLPPFPTEEKVLLIYLTHLVERGAAASTITQAYSAIREHHRMNDAEPPSLDGKLYRSWTGARKKASRGRKIKKAKALTPEDLKTAACAASGGLAARDKAMLLIGWCAALRSAEIRALDQGDIEVSDEGMRVQIRQSKTDQWGAGHEIGIARASHPEVCPIQAWLDYQDEADPERAPAFVSKNQRRLTHEDVTRILRRNMRRAGLDVEGYSAHSLRAGCITAAARAGHSLEAIQRQSRHKSLEVLLGYVRTATLLTDNVTEGLL